MPEYDLGDSLEEVLAAHRPASDDVMALLSDLPEDALETNTFMARGTGYLQIGQVPEGVEANFAIPLWDWFRQISHHYEEHLDPAREWFGAKG